MYKFQNSSSRITTGRAYIWLTWPCNVDCSNEFSNNGGWDFTYNKHGITGLIMVLKNAHLDENVINPRINK